LRTLEAAIVRSRSTVSHVETYALEAMFLSTTARVS
jgi:hypothetical protein